MTKGITHHPACPLASLMGRMNRSTCACPKPWPVGEWEEQPPLHGKPLRDRVDRVEDGRHLFGQEDALV